MSTSTKKQQCPAGDGCAGLDVVEDRMSRLAEMPNTVNRLTGIVSVIAGLFALLVGLAFNSHFEQLAQADKMNKKFDTLGIQMKEISDVHHNSKNSLNERLVRIETRIETAHDAMKRTTR